jgi:hypothetical protein
VLEVDFGMALFFIRPGEASSTNVTAKRFLTSMRADVGGQVVTSREGAMADATLKEEGKN